MFEGALDCVDGQFENYEMQDPYDDRAHFDDVVRAHNILAAGLYAYMGSAPRLVIEKANSILAKQPKTCVPNDCKSVDVELPDGNINIGSFRAVFARLESNEGIPRDLRMRESAALIRFGRGERCRDRIRWTCVNG